MFIIKYRGFFFVFSGILVVASLVSLFTFGLKLGIDFTGGTVIAVSYQTPPATEALKSALDTLNLGTYALTAQGDRGIALRTRATTAEEQQQIIGALSPTGSGATVGRVAAIGPTIGHELRQKSLLSIALVIVAIILYIAFAFRRVSRPVSSWIYGLAAVVGLVHNVIIPVGVFAALGHFTGTEIDTLFVAALLTILGFSVHDTIVVFDRTRENLRLSGGKEDFALIVGKSLRQTYVRSINTSLTVVVVLLALFFLGGASTEDFTLTLLIGVVAGTYSSICLASPLLVAWERMRAKGKN